MLRTCMHTHVYACHPLWSCSHEHMQAHKYTQECQAQKPHSWILGHKVRGRLGSVPRTAVLNLADELEVMAYLWPDPVGRTLDPSAYQVPGGPARTSPGEASSGQQEGLSTDGELGPEAGKTSASAWLSRPWCTGPCMTRFLLPPPLSTNCGGHTAVLCIFSE